MEAKQLHGKGLGAPLCKAQARVMLLVAAGFFCGALAGFAAKGVHALDTPVRWVFAAGIVFFGAGAWYIAAFYRAERAHELQLAAAYGVRDGMADWREPAPCPRLRRVK